MTKKIFFASMKRKRNRGKGMSDKMLVKKAEDFITSKWSGGSTTELSRFIKEKGSISSVKD